MLFLMVGPAAAGTLTETDKSVRSIVSGIVSYTHALSGDEGHSELPYTPVIVRNDQEALAATCDAIYFGSESPAKQLELISQYQGRALLLISEQNPECVIGSAFCLIIDRGQVRFAVNLDALTRSGVRVNPDVLMLARNKQHG